MTKRKRALAVSLCMVSMICYSIGFSQPASDFSSSAEGWNTVGKCPAESSPGVVWSNTGGNPGGCIKAQDNSIGVWYFYAGDASWKGDLSEYYGCDLSFDLKTNNDGWPVGSQYDILIIRGDDYTISYNTPVNPGETWTSYSIPLTAGSWILDGVLDAANCPDLSGSLATAADMISYLSDVKRIRIRAEFGGLNTETNFMDNVEIICPVILPVELSTFTAENLGNNVARLDWTTLSETDCYGYQVEKSLDMVSFDSIGFVPGNGTTMLAHSYEFYDDNFITTSYYRLKQIDLNLKSQYSDIISLHSAIQVESNTQVFPNPANDFIIIIAGDTHPLLAYEITDISGRIITREVVDQDYGIYEQKVSLHDFMPGMYIITFFKTNGAEHQKFEIVK